MYELADWLLLSMNKRVFIQVWDSRNHISKSDNKLGVAILTDEDKDRKYRMIGDRR